MSSVFSTSSPTGARPDPRWLRWAPVGIGLLALYGPTFSDLARGLWTREDHMHAPIVLAVILWVIWQRREALIRDAEKLHPWIGGVLLALGLMLYVVGRSQSIIILEVGSLMPVLAGTLLVMKGGEVLRHFLFPLFFILFMLPLPSFVVDMLTNPLKQHVSAIAESILYALGYPIARSGVILVIGPYQLLVADACSGLHSLLSMSAMGLLYIYLMNHRNIARNAILALSLLPIAFVANVVRVMVLVSVTYHFGDEAGQGFIHDFSGIFLFIVGLMMLFLIDNLLGSTKHFQPRMSRI